MGVENEVVLDPCPNVEVGMLVNDDQVVPLKVAELDTPPPPSNPPDATALACFPPHDAHAGACGYAPDVDQVVPLNNSVVEI
jgi:hypothetical protein